MDCYKKYWLRRYNTKDTFNLRLVYDNADFYRIGGRRCEAIFNGQICGRRRIKQLVCSGILSAGKKVEEG